jgi:hypothetical protein
MGIRGTKREYPDTSLYAMRPCQVPAASEVLHAKYAALKCIPRERRQDLERFQTTNVAPDPAVLANSFGRSLPGMV